VAEHAHAQPRVGRPRAEEDLPNGVHAVGYRVDLRNDLQPGGKAVDRERPRLKIIGKTSTWISIWTPCCERKNDASTMPSGEP
jgi:hypothetical protein